MIRIFKKGTRELHTDVDTYIVHWWSRYGAYSGDETENFQAFTSQEDAEAFAHELRRAFKLIGHTYHTEVSVCKQHHQRIGD